MKRKKYARIRVTPVFEKAYAELSGYLKKSSPMAFLVLPSAMATILDTIENNSRAWPIRRKAIGDKEIEFHLAIVPLAYRRLHLRYLVDEKEFVHLLALWVDGHDEPTYWERRNG